MHYEGFIILIRHQTSLGYSSDGYWNGWSRWYNVGR